MICKFYEINKYKKDVNFFLLYGENEGQKQEFIKSNFSNFNRENTFKYYEKEAKNKLRDKMYSSYDTFLDTKYNVKINQKTIE